MESPEPAASAFHKRALSRRHLLQGLLVAVPFAATLSGCAPRAGTGPNSLLFVFMGSANQQEAVEAQYAGFLDENPTIDLAAQGIASTTWADFANTVATRIAGGTPPDVLDIATEGLGVFRSKGLVTALDDLIGDAKAAVDDYYADIDPTYKKWSDRYGNPDGTTFYMPSGYNTVCLYCNVSVFEKAGVELPGDEDWTWDDFERAAKRIKERTGAFILPFGSAQFTDIMPWLLSNGASTLDADWRTPIIDSDEAEEAAAFCRRMVEKEYSPRPGGAFDAPTQLAQGTLAALAGGRWPTVDMIALDIVDQVQIVKMPKKAMNGGPIGWNAFGILESSTRKERGWSFIEYLITAQAGRDFAAVGGSNIPARRSVALSDSFLDGAPVGTDLLIEVAQYATPVPSPDRGAETQRAIEEAWLQILTGARSPKEGLSRLSSTLAPLL